MFKENKSVKRKKKTKNMKTLNLQGGGCLGYGQTIILTELEKLADRPSYTLFDIIGGTSVGCIIGAHLSVGIPAETVTKFFTESAPNIFKKKWYSKLSMLWGAKYNPEQLELALKNLLGNKTLKDCKTKFIATSYDWVSDRPVYFKSYEKSSQTENYIIIGNDSDIKLWEVCRASAAAQTYFPAYKYKNMVLIDGGNASDNNPDMLILSETISHTNVHIRDIEMLSIGAGNTTWKASPNTMVNPCIAVAGLKTIDIVFSAGESAEVYKASNILKNTYNRLVPDLGDGFEIDDASEQTLNKLKDAADVVIQKQSDVLVKFIP